MSQIASRAATLVAEPLAEVASVSSMASAAPATSVATVPAKPDTDAAASAATRPAAGTDVDTPVSAAANDPTTTTAAASFAAKADDGVPATDAATTAARPAASITTTPVTVSRTSVGTAHVGAPAPLPKSPATAGSIGGAVFALLLVVGLILLLAWLARRMPGLGGASNSSALRIVGSLALGPRERVVVVAVGDTQLLLGVGAGGTRTLHTLAEPLPVAEAKTTPAFAQLLAQHFGKKA